MNSKKPEQPLYLDMDFEESLERFVGVDPAELPDDKRLKLKKKRSGTEPPRSDVKPKGDGGANR